MIVTDLTEDTSSDIVDYQLFYPLRPSNDKLLEWPSTPHESYRQRDIINFHRTHLSTQGKLDDTLLDFSVFHHTLIKLGGRGLDNSYHFNPLFFTKLKELVNVTPKERYDILKSWTHTQSLFSKDFLIFPINVDDIHWYAICCIRSALVFKKKNISRLQCDRNGNLPCIVVLDSMAARRGVIAYKKDIDSVKEYLSLEWLERSCSFFQIATGEVTYEMERLKWESVNCLIVPTPKQPKLNDWDCGVYTIRNCNNIIKYRPSSTIEDIESKFSNYVQECLYSHSDIVANRSQILSTLTTLIEEFDDLTKKLSLPTLNPQYTAEELGFQRSDGITEIDQNIVDISEDNLSNISPITTSYLDVDQNKLLITEISHVSSTNALIFSEFDLTVILTPKIFEIIVHYLLDDFKDINMLLIIKRLRQIIINKNQ